MSKRPASCRLRKDVSVFPKREKSTNWRSKQHHKLLLLACLLFKVAILKERGYKRPNKKKTTKSAFHVEIGWLD